MANDIVKEVEGINQVNIMILSQIGAPIDQPKAASAQLILEKDYEMGKVQKEVQGVMDTWLADINKITEMLIKGKVRTF